MTAIDKLIDFYNENTIVLYKNQQYTLSELKEHFIDTNQSLSLDVCIANQHGIYNQDSQIVKIIDWRNSQKDDLIDL